MKALVLERKDELALRDFPVEEKLGPRDVRIAPRTVGVCGSDVHYYTHGAIGPFVVKDPMILGHEAAGQVVEVGSEVTELKPGDRVCMEPGIPDPASRATRLGKYNLDPAVRFWATPPVHGVLRPTVVHPADFTFKLPDHVSYAEGAMVEPLAVGVHAATKVQVQPGDLAVVIGAGPIGMVTVLAALAAHLGGATDPVTIQKNLPAVSGSTGGQECMTFEECKTMLDEGGDIRYVGPSSIGPFNEDNDPSSAFIGVYKFDADNKPIFANAIEGSTQ